MIKKIDINSQSRTYRIISPNYFTLCSTSNDNYDDILAYGIVFMGDDVISLAIKLNSDSRISDLIKIIQPLILRIYRIFIIVCGY